MSRFSFLAAIALIAATAEVQAAEPALLIAAGRINMVSPAGSATVVRRNGERVAAAHGILLWPGDRLDFRRDGEVTAEVYGRDTVYEAGSRRLTIPERNVGWFGAFEEKVVAPFRRFLSAPRRAISVYAWARDPQGRPTVAATPSPFAPGGRVRLPRGTWRVALIWATGPAMLDVTAKGAAPSRIDSGRSAWALVPLPPGGREVVVTAGPGLRWSVEFTEDPPRPPPGEAAGPALSEAQRLARAIWLLDEGALEWRVFAVTELADLAEKGNFVADQMWTGARSGELAPLLWP